MRETVDCRSEMADKKYLGKKVRTVVYHQHKVDVIQWTN